MYLAFWLSSFASSPLLGFYLFQSSWSWHSQARQDRLRRLVRRAAPYLRWTLRRETAWRRQETQSQAKATCQPADPSEPREEKSCLSCLLYWTSHGHRHC
ncbi:hypothetical protein IWX90DRAFT_422061 [Phyllosticta citrichinensis]|uniref:Secreted protein n=1 Tax=Phyllosticta citrichinensis TaxID=1130410 RepID=A0ABR1Y7F8_9PEZI